MDNEEKNLDLFHQFIMIDLYKGDIEFNKYCVLATKIRNKIDYILNLKEEGKH